jgi:myo-inositol 2-dehydrogenase / D-chiro-inositol 1-dehydrogenase
MATVSGTTNDTPQDTGKDTGGDTVDRVDVVRYGIIGTGMMGIEHIENILHLDGAVVTAVADPHPPSRKTGLVVAAADYPVHEFEHHRDLIDSGECDAVVIASPNHTHAEVLLDVLASDLHVMVEKPLCTTSADCRRAIEAAERGPEGRVVWMGLEYRYMPPTRALLHELAKGTAGNVKMVSIREHRFPFLRKVDNWNRFSETTGGTLVEKCCHFFDLMNLVTGSRPVRVMASGSQAVNHLDEEYDGRRPDMLDNAFVIVEYENGARGMLDLCMFAEASKNEQELVVTGDAGKLEALVTEGILRMGNRSDGLHVVSERSVDDPNIKHRGLHHGSSYLEHLAFLDAIRTGSPAAVTLTDGLWSVIVGEAAHLSIAEGRTVEISELTG